MQIVKKLTFSDVNSGDISLGSISTNCPTTIRATVSLSADFDYSTVFVELMFTPTSGSGRTTSANLGQGDATGFESQLTASGNIGIFTDTSGTLKVNINTGGSGSLTMGAATLIVDITAFPIS